MECKVYPAFLLPLNGLVVTFVEHYDLLCDLCTQPFTTFTCIVYTTVFRVGYMGYTDSSEAIFCLNNGFLSLFKLNIFEMVWNFPIAFIFICTVDMYSLDYFHFIYPSWRLLLIDSFIGHLSEKLVL